MTRMIATRTTTDTPLVTTAETVIATLPGVSTYRPGATVHLRGSYTITLGTATTAVTTRIRRDSISGTVVGEAGPEQISTAAGSTERHSISTEDAISGEIAAATYVLTAQQTAATGNGNVLRADLEAEIAS